jgi:hypothetical protein
MHNKQGPIDWVDVPYSELGVKNIDKTSFSRMLFCKMSFSRMLFSKMSFGRMLFSKMSFGGMSFS